MEQELTKYLREMEDRLRTVLVEQMEKAHNHAFTLVDNAIKEQNAIIDNAIKEQVAGIKDSLENKYKSKMLLNNTQSERWEVHQKFLLRSIESSEKINDTLKLMADSLR